METIEYNGNVNLNASLFSHQLQQPQLKTPIRLSVLYADENEDNCFMLQTLLGFSGINLSCIHSAQAAWRAAQETYFDLYLLDTWFADGSGLELGRRLRGVHPRTPIVFYSSQGFAGDCRNGLAAGADAYLIKPESEKVAPTIFELVARVRAEEFQSVN